MIRLLLNTFIFIWSGSWFAQTGVCYNSGFEQTAPGSYTAANAVSGWSLSSATYSACGTTTWMPGSQEFSILATPIPGTDFGLLSHAPTGGTNIAVLNSKSANGSITRLQRTIELNPQTCLMQLSLAGAWQTSTHSCCAQAGFTIRLTDTLGAPLNCGTYSFSGTSCSNMYGYTTQTTFNYSNWQVKYLDLTTYTAQGKIVLEVEARDCANQDHWGYLYFDYLCAYPGISTCNLTSASGPWNVPFCPGASSVSIEGSPNFMAYQWISPPGYTITPSQSTLSALTITNPQANSVFTLIMTNWPGCTLTSTITLVSQTVVVTGTSAAPSCSAGASGVATVAAFGGVSNFSYLWAGSSGTVAGTSSVATGLAPGSYTVYVTAAGSQSNSCGVAPAVFTIGTGPPALQQKIASFCSGQNANLFAGTGTNFQWYSGSVAISSASGGTNAALAVVNPSTGAIYAVAFDSPQGCRDTVRHLLINIPPGKVTVTNNLLTCADTHTGSAVISFSSQGYAMSNNSTITAISLSNTPSFSLSQYGVTSVSLSGLSAPGVYSISVSDGYCIYDTTFSVNTQIRPLLSPTATNAVSVCSGMHVPVSVTPLNMHVSMVTHSWSPTTWLVGNNGSVMSTIISPTTPPGTSATIIYTIEVNPKTIPCPATETIAVTIYHPQTPTITTIPPLCNNNGNITLSATPGGGTFFSTFQGIDSAGILNPALLAPGNYTFSYSNASGTCTASKTATITILGSPTISISGNTSICAGETTTLNATGAQIYFWPGFGNSDHIIVAPAATTSYVVTGSSANGCNASHMAIVLVTPQPSVTVSGNTQICAGESAVLTASGADNFAWSNNVLSAQNTVSPLSTTAYSVLGLNLPGNCTHTQVVTITVHPSPTVTISGKNTVCAGDLLQLTASGAQGYEWDGIPGAAVYTAIIQANTSIVVKGIDQNGCTHSNVVSVVVEDCTGLAEMIEERSAKIYPNPVENFLSLLLEYNSLVTLSDSRGLTAMQKHLFAGRHTLDVRFISAGIYFLHITTPDSAITLRVVKISR